MWSYYESYLSAGRDILGLQLPEHAKFEPWERAAKLGGFRWMHPKFCMVCDFPDVIERDEQNRPHCATGPSHRWSDGWSLYHWHGVRVPDFVIEAPETITVSIIEHEQNAEIRRVMIERYGQARYLKDSGAEVVHELPMDYPVKGLRGAKLLKKDRPDDSPIIMIDVENSTAEPDGSVKRYQLRVQPDAYDGDASKNCHAAMASTWRRQDNALYFAKWKDYRPEIET